jgi:hypothetical protein
VFSSPSLRQRRRGTLVRAASRLVSTRFLLFADGMYLRIIVHANEHMGQLIGYARMSGFAPPWSEAN